MRIAFTTKGNNWDSEIDPRFGRTLYIFIYDDESDSMEIIDNTGIEDVAHGAGPMTAQKLAELKADVLITGNGPGGNAARVLQQTGLKIYTGAGNMSAQKAYESWKAEKLTEFVTD